MEAVASSEMLANASRIIQLINPEDILVFPCLKTSANATHTAWTYHSHELLKVCIFD